MHGHLLQYAVFSKILVGITVKEDILDCFDFPGDRYGMNIGALGCWHIRCREIAMGAHCT